MCQPHAPCTARPGRFHRLSRSRRPRRATAAFLAVTCAAASLLALPAPARALPLQAPAEHALADEGPTAGSSLTVRDGRLLGLLREMEERSPTAREMLATLRSAGVPVVVGSVESVEREVRAAHRDYDVRRRGALGFMAPELERGGPGGPSTRAIYVGIDIDRVERLFAGTVLPRHAARLETLALLAHELIHAYGLVLARGDPRGGCLDPVQGQDPAEACVVVGENVVRRELGAPLDWGYGVSSMTTLIDRYRVHDALVARSRAASATALALLRSDLVAERP